jgi:type II secretory pathway pseudopilin PulG
MGIERRATRLTAGPAVFPRRLKPARFGLRGAAEAAPFQSSGLSDSRLGAGTSKRKRAGEEGYILIAVLFLMVMILIALSIAAPKVAADIQRDREIELQHRGLQYVRAIKLYYKKFGAYPPNMDALEKSNEIRFLRKRYKDPATGKDEWHLIHFGEAKTPTAMGFFGQALGGGLGSQTLAGTGPGGVGQSNVSPIGGSTTDPNAGSTGTSGSTTTPTGTPTTPTDPNSPTGTIGTTGTTGTTGGSTTGSSSSAFGNSTTSGTGQTFGGGGIIGVESTSPKATILEYKKKKHFNEWEFVYDPASERLTLSNNTGAIGQPVGSGNYGGANGTGGTQPVVPSPGQGNQAPPGSQAPQQPQQ